MSDDGMLSQEEIDALLGNTSDDFNESKASNRKDLKDYINEMEQDVLGEIGNISFGSAATALSTILNQKVDITTPVVSLVEKGDLEKEFPVPYVSVLVNYTEGFKGSNVLMIKTQDASVIADLMMGGAGSDPKKEVGEMELSAVQEAMNQMMGSSATSMSTVFDRKIDISPPTIELMDIKTDRGTSILPDDDTMFKISFHLTVGNLIDSSIMQIVPIDFAKELVTHLLNKDEDNAYDPVKDDQSETVTVSQDLANDLEPFRSKQDDEIISVAKKTSSKSAQSNLNVQAVAFPEFDQQTDSMPKKQNLELLFDIPLQVSVELGQTKKTIKEVLELSQGSIIELDKLAGEPVDILINQKPIAKGEVVVIDENFGVRITEIINQRDRLNKI
ncbi:flagellar motor switch phosphatase FliY [Scopulibacillus cellulosilyticus]|uniref:Flagellar motor switch phosphatase FliY n=1 Tax=Scopulibacillus cellulosilyticus TaxID=2665665 RepID=A0ABW2PTQ5_9BACL